MIYKNKLYFILLFVVFTVINFSGCFYSFTGASVPPHLKTVYIAPVDDRSGSGELRLRENFKEKLTEKFLNDNTLQVAERANADALVECTIVSFTDIALTVSPGNRTTETVSGKQITIGAKVLFRDLVKKKTISEKNYSSFDVYSTTSGNVQDNRIQAVNNTIDKLSDDILIGTVSNW